VYAKITLVVLIVCLALLPLDFSNGQQVVTIKLSSNGTIEPISRIYSYIIDVSGSDYQAKNGTTGQIDYQSTNCTEVVNNAIRDLTRGSIFFKAGVYNLNGRICYLLLNHELHY
jgi:hypothetical protein